jgi:hypothetical protein
MNDEIQEVRGYLLRAIEEKGADYVYSPPEPENDASWLGPSCLYVHNGAPSCLVGHVLHYASAPLRGEHEGLSAEAVVPEVTNWSPRVAEALNFAQAMQDKGKSWKLALRAFDIAVAS